MENIKYMFMTLNNEQVTIEKRITSKASFESVIYYLYLGYYPNGKFEYDGVLFIDIFDNRIKIQDIIASTENIGIGTLLLNIMFDEYRDSVDLVNGVLSIKDYEHWEKLVYFYKQMELKSNVKMKFILTDNSKNEIPISEFQKNINTYREHINFHYKIYH